MQCNASSFVPCHALTQPESESAVKASCPMGRHARRNQPSSCGNGGGVKQIVQGLTVAINTEAQEVLQKVKPGGGARR